jgi:cobalamin-dependent methionine synthase I
MTERKPRKKVAENNDVLMVRMPARLKERFAQACDLELVRPSVQARALLSAWIKEMAKEYPEILESDKRGETK